MSKSFHLSIFTPRLTFFERDVKELNIEIANGYIGILPDHIPIISSIKPSTFLIKGEKKDKFEGIIESGVLYFDKNILKIFTTNIIWKNEVEKRDAESNIESISEKLNTKELSDFERKRLTKLLKYYQLQL